MSDQLSERLAGLSPQAQRAWLTQLLHRRQHAPTRAPLSFAQERLWILHQLDPNSAAYHIPLALRLTGTLDLSALRHSLNAVVQRHAVLRTTFVLEAGQALQVIAPHLTLEAPVVEVDARSLAEREAQLQQALQEEARQPFDLSRGPLLRARVWRLGPAEHVLLVTLHHSVADAWSVAIFSRELAALYQAALARQPAALLDLPLQYADYAAWQREWLRGELLESQLVYWQQQLTGAPELLTWPADHPRPAVQTQRGATQFFTLSPEVTAGLTAFSRHEGVTLFMTLLAAFNVLLHRYTGQTDIVVGTPVANRNRRELEELIGFFVNTLALRTRLGGGDTVRELVRRVREGVLAATAHQDVPFERVVEHLQPVRQLDRSPVFQVLLGLQNVPGAVLELPGVQVEALAVETGAAAFDLTLLLEERAGGLRGVVEYSTDLFEATTIARLVEHFQVVLEGMVADPEQRLAQLPLLTEAERQQVLVEWNDTAVDYPHDGCIHRLFEAQVERTPDAVAVVYEDQSLTYGELNGRANRLAHYLRRLGIGPERLVGMCFDRSVEMIVSVLGALKAGGAYLPLDPSYPIERLAFMLEDSQAPVLLTQSHWLAARSAPLGVSEIVCLDTDWSVIAQESDQNPDSVTTAADLAYVIYTSGSTGRPKGVMIPHRSVLNLFTGLNRTIYANHPQRPMRISLNAPLPFDASVQQWVMLLKGHTLYIVPQAARQDGNALVSYIRRNQLDVLDCVPSQLKLLLAAGLLDGTGWAPSIVLPGGEALDEATWQTLTRAAGTDFYNMYGPTECTVDSTVCRMKTAASQPTIGRPIANARCYILDAQLQPVPIGVSGELHMGGLGLARGYLNRPDLTAERFIPNPFLKDDYSPRSEAEWEGGGRRDEENFSDSSLILHHLPPKRSGGGSSLLYKTGDLARYLSDGNLEFLGRIDQQVKVRGFRIELGEIEAALSQHPAVRECVVAAQAWGATDDKRLVAYLTPKADASSSFIPPPSSFVSELRAFLRVKLPEYMLPSAFVVLEAFPLTPNGKVDRKALPALDGAQVAASEHYVAPRTPAEELAAGIWAEVLGIKTVGVNDNFFELGGHSLLATQVVSRIQEVFQVQLPLRALFESPTLEDLARAIEQLQQGDAPRPFRAIQPVSRAGELPLSFAQERLWFIDQLVPGSSAYNIPTALRIKGDLDVAALESSLNEVIRRHESLRTTFAAHDGQSMQVIAPNVILKLPSVDLRAWPEADRESEARRRAEAEARRPFDLAHGPLLRAELFCLDQAAHVLVLNLHHIIADGWSSAVLVREVTELYAAFAQEQSPALGAERRGLPLPELPIQYADFAVWQRQWLQGEVLDAQLAYWRRQLAGLPILELPTDRPRPPAQTFRGGTQAFRLSPALTQALASLSQREGATLFMTLLAAFQTLLARYTGQTDIAVGTGIANRRRAEIEGLIGFFVNTLVLRTDLAGNPTFREVLARVREVALEAYAHQDAPFELVVDAVGPQRDLSHSPLFQVFFVLQNMPQQALKLAGFEIELLPVDNGTAKFDLGFQLYEVDDGLYGLVEYSVDLFEADTIQRLVGHYAMLLESVVAHPDQPIALLPLLPEAERRQLLEVWNDTAAALPADACAQQLFEAQVARTPAAIAVRFAGESLTYAELNRRANQLAHHLRRYGVGPEVRVGILIERSIEMVVGVLGVLKAGAAYVPLDPEYPASRLAFMLQDAGVNVLLAHAPLLSKLPEHNARVICLDTDWSAIAQSPSSNLCVSVAPENLAYVIYTSGSTGLPKGTLLHHRGLCNLAQTLRDKFELGSESRLLQFAAFSFDASVSEMFAALTTGARLVLAPREQLLSPLDLIELLQTEGITCVTLPPSLLAVLSTAELPALRTLISAGEACPWEVAERWAEGRRFLNGYGPTETTVAASYYEVNERVAGAQLVPIGKPNPNTTIYLLDSNGQPAPIGVPGEICIGGVGVGRGYLNRPDLTAEKFIPNPFFDEGRRTTDEGRNAGSAPLSSFVHRHSSSRLYRTGDLARWRPDGNLEFLGRIDQQVKFHGYRIEPGEIEAVLRQHPAVKDTVVLPQTSASVSDKQLVAYIVPEPSGLDTREIASEQVEQWQTVFDAALKTSATVADPQFNIAGWNSSYTGEPIPAQEMREWVDQTVSRILALRPQRVLEIGCGAGLLLHRIAPQCESYWGTDFSPIALRALQDSLAASGLESSKVRLSCQTADDFEGLPDQAFDAVVLNSVIQYFPDVEYLLRVLEGVVNLVKPGGHIFIGDVRHLPLLAAYHTSVELYRAPDSLTTERLAEHIRQRVSEDQELVIDPDFFLALKAQTPDVAWVDIRPKRGQYDNELIRFRYDVVLGIGPTHANSVAPEWLDWERTQLTVTQVRQRLAEQEPDVLAIRNIPNARVVNDTRAMALLADRPSIGTVAGLRAVLQSAETAAVDPEAMWALEAELPYRVELSWIGSEAEGRFAAIFRRVSSSGAVLVPGNVMIETAATRRAWNTYANNPLYAKLARRIVPELRRHLQEKLPAYMLPSAFVTLEAFPLTPSGKVDRKALPAPEGIRPPRADAFTPPSTELEEKLVAIWREVLGLERVGVHDNFFESGGDSLRVIQVIDRANRVGLRLTPRQFFQNPTVAELARVAGATDDRAGQAAMTGVVPLTPSQRWFLAQPLVNSSRFNIAQLFEVYQPLNPALLEQAIQHVVLRHDSLRARFVRAETRWQQIIQPPGAPAPFTYRDISELPTAAQTAAIEDTTGRLQESLSLSDGPLFWVVYFNLGIDRPGRIFVLLHHILADGYSLGIVLEDLQTAYVQLMQGQPIQLPPKTTSLKEWTERLDAYMHSEAAQHELAYWLTPPWALVPGLPFDYPENVGRDDLASFRSSSFALEAAETKYLLQEVLKYYNVQPIEAFLTALVQALTRWSGGRQHPIILLDSGRTRVIPEADDLDLSRVVGWLSLSRLIVLEHAAAENPEAALRSIVEQLNRIPNRGVGYSLLSHSGVDAIDRKLKPHPKYVMFNYVVDQADSPARANANTGLLRPAQESTGKDQDPREIAFNFLECYVAVSGGRLQVTWKYSENLFKPATIESITQDFFQALRSLMAHYRAGSGAALDS